MNRVITISRQFGSGGRTIGRQVAAKLGIPCYDNELLEKLAEKSGFTPEYIKERGEYTERGGWLANALSGRVGGGMNNQDHIWIAQRELILDLAKQGPCVIVGRCADYVLRERDDVLNVFIHAPMEYRAQRAKEVYEREAGNMVDYVKKPDKKRASFYNYFSQNKWGDARHYHLAISGQYGVDYAVEILKRAVETFPGGGR